MTCADIVDAAALALRRAGIPEVGLGLTEVVVDYPKAATVLIRARVVAPSAGLPHTVIVKRFNTGQGIEIERAGLAFVTGCVATRSFVPHLLAFDADARLLVMTDVDGPETSRVGDLLFGQSRDRAEKALVAAQEALGRLHTAGIGQQETYRRLRASRGSGRASRHAVNELEALLSDLPRLLSVHLRGPIPKEVDDEVRAARVELFGPSPFVTMTHGDPTVGNLLYSPATGIKLVDFETAGYRHALLDGCFARLRYLYSVWAHRIPAAVQNRLLHTYRTELAKGCPQAADDASFARGLVAASAAWLAALCAHLDRVPERDVRWGRASYRQRIAVGLDHFVTVVEEYGQLPTLGETARALLDHLSDVWPATDRQLDVYPALVNG